MVVTQTIESIEAPEKIRGKAGEKFDIIITCSLAGSGSSYQYIELYADGTLIGEGVTEEPWEPNGIKWTAAMEVLKDIPPGMVLYFDVRVGHLEGEARIQDDSRTFEITVERAAIPWWMIGAAVASVAALALGMVWIRK